MKNYSVELKCYNVIQILQCIIHLNHLVNSNVIIFSYSSYFRIFGWIIFVHSHFSLTPLLTNDFSLNHKNFYYICLYVNSVLIVKNSNALVCYRLQRSWGKVIFSQACVILLTGGSASEHAGIPPPPPNQGPGTPPGPGPPGSRHPPPAQSMLGDTVNARAVRILLECILVW